MTKPIAGWQNNFRWAERQIALKNQVDYCLARFIQMAGGNFRAGATGGKCSRSQKNNRRNMLKQYQVNHGFDEMADAQNGVRPHYQKFHKLFGELTEPEFQSKREAID